MTMRAFIALTLVLCTHTELCETLSTLPEAVNCTVKEHLPCNQYAFFKLAECAPENLARLFPALYGEDNWPGQAYSFNLMSTEQYSFANKLYNVAVVNLTFQPPHNVGVKSVRGFEVMIYKNSADLPTCVILDLSNATWKGDLDDMRTEFQLSIVVSPSNSYRLELYCLPRPQLEHSDIDQYQYVNFVSPNYDQPWTASIYWKAFPAERRVAVMFDEGSQNSSFTQFQLTLHACFCEDDCKCLGYTSDSTQRHLISENFHNFTNVQPGYYSIWVKPVDPYFTSGNPQKCLCTREHVCDPCATTNTSVFQFQYDSTTTSPGLADTDRPTDPVNTGSSTSPTDPVGPVPKVQPTETPDDETNIKIIASVLGCVVGLCLAAFGFLLYYQRRQTQKTDNYIVHDKDKMHENIGFHDDNGSVITIDVMKRSKLNKMPNNENKNLVLLEKVPKLFILYEEDHELHRIVVDSFASYLHHYCQCQVMCASWQQDASWVHQEMQQADYVVIVNSEAAYNIYKSRKGGKSAQSGSNSSRVTSINSVLEMFLQDARYDNIIMVFFEHTDEKFLLPDICPGYNYRLMKHFTDFLIHVHQLRRTDNLAQYDLPFDGNHNHRGVVGQQLIQAIDQCKRYERENPKWCLLKYGMLRSYSNTSDESQLDSGVGEMPSLPETLNLEFQEPWPIHPEICAYVKQLDQVSQDVLTIDPPANIFSGKPPHPVLSPHSFAQNENYGNSPLRTQPSTAESGQFDFLPPDDFHDADLMSKTQSEQMMSIVDRYHGNSGVSSTPSYPATSGHTYNRDHDLALLRVQSGEIPFTIDLTDSGDIESLGGESV